MSGSLDLSRFRPPESFLEIAERLETEGFEAWAVGGSIRDQCALEIGGAAYVPASDWDLATNAHPEEVMHLFRRTVPVGIEHGTVGVLSGDVLVEVTTFRRDIETDGRHATVVFAEEIEQDLERRDFTINAIAWRPSTNELRDPTGGVADLTSGLLRAVGTAEDRFREDYLRVLRGFRFAGRFDLEIEPETASAMAEAVAGLGRLSAERIREELMKVLADPVPSSALDFYATSGALTHWYPEVAVAAEDREIWLKTVASVDEVPSHRPALRLARWLVQTAVEPDARAAAARSLTDRLRFSNADQKRVVHLVRHYLPFVGPLDSSSQQRRWLAEVEDAWRDVIRLHIADARALRSDRGAGYIAATWRAVHEEILSGAALSIGDLAIDGDDVLGLGVVHGPIVGLLLEELLEQVIEDPEANERDRLLEEAQRLIELGSLAGARPPDPSGG